MAITTYAELQTAISDRLARVDLTATVLQEFIALAEAEMQRILKTLDQETKSAAFSITGEYVAVPTGLQAVRSFVLNTAQRTPLAQMTSDAQSTIYKTAAKPLFYEVVGANFRFAPVPDETYAATLVYLAKFDPLSVSVTTNWLLTAHPDVYLFGALKHACEKTQDYGLSDRYDGKFREIIGRIQSQSNKSRWSGPGMQVRAA